MNNFSDAVEEAKDVLTAEYHKIEQLLNDDDTMMLEQLKKNLAFHTLQFNYLKEKSEEAFLIKHEVALRKFTLLETELFPHEGFQERIYTPYVYMNQYGPKLVQDLLKLPLEIDGTHKVIYL